MNDVLFKLTHSERISTQLLYIQIIIVAEFRSHHQ